MDLDIGLIVIKTWKIFASQMLKVLFGRSRYIFNTKSNISNKELAETKPYIYTDKPEQVEMLVDATIIDQVVDWFGTGIRVGATDEPARVKVTLSASPNAMEHWAMQYIDYVEVTAPEELRKRIREALRRGMEKYEN